MLSENQQLLVRQHFPFLDDCSAAFLEAFNSHANYVRLPAGAPICREGEFCAHLAMVVEGVGRVYKLAPNGREVTLYRIYAGESCVLTASCIMSQDSFPAMAQTETDAGAVLIAPRQVQDWFCIEPNWQRFIFGLLSHRLGDIVSLTMFFLDPTELMRHVTHGETSVYKTHADLAADVGSSREVISRILKDFADRGMVRLTRGKIEMIDTPTIAQLAAS